MDGFIKRQGPFNILKLVVFLFVCLCGGNSLLCLCWCCPLQAVEELFNLMQLFVAQRADMREEELEDIKQFKKTTISCYLRCLDGRSCWTTLIRSGHSRVCVASSISGSYVYVTLRCCVS